MRGLVHRLLSDGRQSLRHNWRDPAGRMGLFADAIEAVRCLTQSRRSVERERQMRKAAIVPALTRSGGFDDPPDRPIVATVARISSR